MVQPWPKLLVILLVASLQFFAPLIHAHTKSVPNDHAPHIHSDATGVSSAIDVVDVDHDHGQAIGVAKEYKRDYTLLLFVALLVATLLISLRRVWTPHFRRIYAPPARRFARPCPQAP